MQQADFDTSDFEHDDPDNLPVSQIGSPVSPPPHWLERGEPQYQAGLIVDAADGQLPDLVNPGGDGSSGGGREHAIDRNATLTERLARVDDETILYSMTVDDPETWAAPWTVQFPWKIENDYGMFEYACHEGNYALRNTLSGARAEEAGAAAK